MNGDYNQSNVGGMNPGEAPMGQGRPMPPPPPPPEITLRTMQSDLQSMQQSGGENPVPQPFTPPEVKKTSPAELAPVEEDMIRPGVGEGVIPPMKQPKSKLKAVLLILVLLLVIGGLAWAGYVYVYPLFVKTATPVAQPVTEAPLPVVETINVPEGVPAPSPETPEIVTPEPIAPEILPITEPEVVLPSPVLKAHSSYLITPADSSVTLSTTGIPALNTLRDVLIAESNNKPATETALKETILSNEGGQLVFAEVLPAYLAEFQTTELSSLFEEDFTTVLSYDKNGAWPGMIAKLKEGADSAAAKKMLVKIEQSVNLANLYLQNPGTPFSGGFRDGSANNLATRYLSYSQTGASLNYAWTSNNLLVISTSYNGMKNILARLGIQ